MVLEKQFNPDLLYNKIVHYYIDKKRYSKDRANKIAQQVLQKEANRRTCKNKECKHFSHEHIRNSETCLISDCKCSQFTK